jgi:hypothetical protein
MYNIARQGYGFQITFGGKIDLEEMNRWREDSRKVLAGAPRSFGVLIDMRDLRPGDLAANAQPVMVEGQQMYRKAGMERSCVILQSATVTMQFQRLAHESGIDAYERYINAAAHPDWHTEALAWIEKKIDPGR